VNDGHFSGAATGQAVGLLAKVLLQREQTKKLLIGAACLFFIIASIVVVIFAPPEKQGLAYVLGAALVVMALRAIELRNSNLDFLVSSSKPRPPDHKAMSQKPHFDNAPPRSTDT
jgi:hypothetical protein